MSAPTTVATIAARSKTGRRAIGMIVALFFGFWLVVLGPVIAVIALSATATHAATPDPANAAPPVVVGGWGYPLHGPYSKGRGFGYDGGIKSVCAYCSTEHQGYDMSQQCGATVHAAASGRVVVAGQYFGYGNAVMLANGSGISTLYGHMQWGSLRVHLGETVSVGAPLGAEGSTGHSTGCHLHFEVRVNGTAIDPQPFMTQRGLPLH